MYINKKFMRVWNILVDNDFAPQITEDNVIDITANTTSDELNFVMAAMEIEEYLKTDMLCVILGDRVRTYKAGAYFVRIHEGY